MQNATPFHHTNAVQRKGKLLYNLAFVSLQEVPERIEYNLILSLIRI